MEIKERAISGSATHDRAITERVLSERAEEALETLWIRTVEGGEARVSRDQLADDGDGALRELAEAGCIAEETGGVSLTARGRPLAQNVVRRHRLAERLLADVLDAWNEANHEKACRFEHLLDRGLDDSICILLGHPKVCPHGKPIPPGKCCTEHRDEATKLVSPLAALVEGQSGKVAYIHSDELSRLQKLTAMGILPGAHISVIQTYPAYVFQVGHTQFAVDREIAAAIYVRLSADDGVKRVESAAAGGRGIWPWRRQVGNRA
jgi:DtxR family Mn-dependent transcriptional regulator